MSSYDIHELTARTDLQILQLQFNENVLPASLNEHLVLSRCLFCATLDEDRLIQVEQLFALLEKEEKGGMFSDVLKKSLVTQIVIAVVRAADPKGRSVMPGRLQQAVGYIHSHFREKVSLETVARHCNVTPNYLGARFARVMGRPFSDYLNAVRLRYACNLLVSSDLSGKEIAFASGYSSVEYFYYIFKKTMGVTPAGYRKKG